MILSVFVYLVLEVLDRNLVCVFSWVWTVIRDSFVGRGRVGWEEEFIYIGIFVLIYEVGMEI